MNMKKVLLFLTSFLGLALFPLCYIVRLAKKYVYDIIYSQSIKYFFHSPYPRFVSITSPIYINNAKYITIGEHSRISEYSTISAWNEIKNPKLVIGNNVRIGAFAHITCANEIHIGDGVLLGKNVTITDNSHGCNSYSELKIRPHNRQLFSKGKVHIGKNVWIGDKATILPGVSIGDNSIIGANSVVTKNIPGNCIACGVPAKVISRVCDQTE